MRGWLIETVMTECSLHVITEIRRDACGTFESDGTETVVNVHTT
jgi:hypothetical protein